jgi:hypothetical protein
MNKVIQSDLPLKSEFSQIDSNLFELLIEAKALFENLDRYSSQVRVLEKELQKINANFPYKLKIKEELESFSRPILDRHAAWCIGMAMLGYTQQDVYYLSWEIDDHAKNFRLFLVVEEKEFVLFDSAESVGIRREFISQVKLKKPLIETDMHTRLRYCEYLNGFIQSFKEHLKNYRAAIEMGASLK